MQSAIGSVLRTALNPIARPACRIVGGTRYPLSRRTFHHSTILCRIPDNQSGKGSEEDDRVPEAPKSLEKENAERDVADVSSSIADTDNSTVPKTGGRQTKSRLRARRQGQPQGLPPVAIPDWFWERNIKRPEEPFTGRALSVYGDPNVEEKVEAALAESSTSADKDVVLPEKYVEGEENATYTVHKLVLREIIATLNAELTLRPPPRMDKSTLRPVTLLHCPKDGGTYFLDSLMENVASKLEADLVRLDAQDIAQIVGPYVDENLAWTDSETSCLGYSAAEKAREYRKELELSGKGDSISSTLKRLESSPVDAAKHLLDDLRNGSSSRRSPRSQVSNPVLGILQIGSDTAPPGQTKSGSDWQGLKISTALDALVGAADSKAAHSAKKESTEAVEADAPARNLIIQVKGYNDLSMTTSGPGLLRALRSVVDKRWQGGRNIIVVGTASSDNLEFSSRDVHLLQTADAEAETRTIVVPPERKEGNDVTFIADEKTRIRNINLRHLQDMIMKLKDGDKIPDLAVNIESHLVSDSSLEKEVWTYARVRRLATVAIGWNSPPTRIDGDTVTKALDLLSDSDSSKFTWGIKGQDEAGKKENSTGDLHKDKFNKIKQRCSLNEKQLLSGVKIPSEINTSFSDIHAPEDTVEALRTLTSLSLLRPEAFSYGVLAKDKIPGVMLYGPPGTGKTLLAKAVARESGAIVLEVSGATVNNMYVGEGEKNVKAIFTLAKKLSPCVVFIDEADGLLGTRGDGGGDSKQSGTHRETINQFLREWDGMSDHSAFIMVATNRPYDLDEAVLRRLPRRLLVDLPLEKDRAAILQLHLQDEVLDPSVSILEIAATTPYYSGSDLKNICVAAALACLRDENAAAQAHDGPEPYVHPEKRTLTKAHFNKALDEISASISDDMSTLKAIRRFDEKYGQRKGRRKKGSALGFGGTMVEQRDSEAARVRGAEA